eukprot:3012563-Pleurochrysis_carterae.AAC.2
MDSDSLRIRARASMGLPSRACTRRSQARFAALGATTVPSRADLACAPNLPALPPNHAMVVVMDGGRGSC